MESLRAVVAAVAARRRRQSSNACPDFDKAIPNPQMLNADEASSAVMVGLAVPSEGTALCCLQIAAEASRAIIVLATEAFRPGYATTCLTYGPAPAVRVIPAFLADAKGAVASIDAIGFLVAGYDAATENRRTIYGTGLLTFPTIHLRQILAAKQIPKRVTLHKESAAGLGAATERAIPPFVLGKTIRLSPGGEGWKTQKHA